MKFFSLVFYANYWFRSLHPAEVKVTEVSGDYSCVIELRVAKEDIGKVIGKKGAHAQAIRTLMMAASGKDGKRYILEILDD